LMFHRSQRWNEHSWSLNVIEQAPFEVGVS
jgi:hypothetical protein